MDVGFGNKITELAMRLPCPFPTSSCFSVCCPSGFPVYRYSRGRASTSLAHSAFPPLCEPAKTSYQPANVCKVIFKNSYKNWLKGYSITAKIFYFLVLLTHFAYATLAFWLQCGFAYLGRLYSKPTCKLCTLHFPLSW